VGICWSGALTFLILLVMEGVIQGYRKARGTEEPAFQLVLDTDVILDHEIGDDFSAKEGSCEGSGRGVGGGPIGESLRLDMMASGREHREEQAVGELDGHGRE
jgi:hypothetical protein